MSFCSSSKLKHSRLRFLDFPFNSRMIYISSKSSMVLPFPQNSFAFAAMLNQVENKVCACGNSQAKQIPNRTSRRRILARRFKFRAHAKVLMNLSMLRQHKCCTAKATFIINPTDRNLHFMFRNTKVREKVKLGNNTRR